jgi:DME family drug/metabolite transporter
MAAVLFGTSGTAARMASPVLGSAALATWRVIVGGTALVAVSWAVGCAPWRYPARAGTVLLGSATVVGFQLCYFAAVGRLGVTQATVLTISIAPVAAGVSDHVRGRARLTTRWAAGVTVAVAGVAVMGNGSWRLDTSGWVAAVLAGCCFPIYAGVLRTLATDRPGIAAVASVFGGAVPLAAVGLLASGAAAVPAVDDLPVVTYVGLVATAAAYVLWNFGLRALTVRDTVLITMVEPVTAAVLAATVLGEPLPPAGLVGIAAILLGLALAATRPARLTA